MEYDDEYEYAERDMYDEIEEGDDGRDVYDDSDEEDEETIEGRRLYRFLRAMNGRTKKTTTRGSTKDADGLTKRQKDAKEELITERTAYIKHMVGTLPEFYNALLCDFEPTIAQINARIEKHDREFRKTIQKGISEETPFEECAMVMLVPKK